MLSPLGVKLSYFYHLIDTNGGRDAFKGLTTAQVCMNYVIPMTANSKLSLVEHLAQDTTQSHFVAPANWYISHTWLYLFLETVDSLDRFFAKHGLQKDAVVWFCVFNNNQHLSHTYPFEFWSNTFQSQLQAIGNVVMIMHPWDDPIVLRRSWCVFEVYVSIKVNARFEMAMASTQQEAFFKDIENDRAFMNMLGSIKSENSVAAVASDRDGIFELIRSEVSFEKLDQMIFTTITTWIKNAIREHIDIDLAGNVEDQADFWRALGNIHDKECEYAQCADCLRKSLSLYLTFMSENEPKVIEIKALLCHAVAAAGAPQSEWEPMYLSLLQAHMELFGPHHDTTLTTQSNVALTYAQCGQLQKAVVLFEQAHEASLVVRELTDPKTLTSMNNIGTIYSMMYEFDKALPWQLKCLQLRRETLGADHPLTIQSLNNLGMLYRGQGLYEKALPLLVQSSEFYKRAFGLNHLATWTSLINLANTQLSQGNITEAKANIERVWPLIQENAPPTHLLHATGALALAVLCWSSEEYDNANKYFIQTVKWREERLGRSKSATLEAIDTFYLFQMHPAVRKKTSLAFEALQPYYTIDSADETDTETWLGLRCTPCAKMIVGNAYLCPSCPPKAFVFCNGCKQRANEFCDHNYLDTIPPPRQFFQQPKCGCFSFF